MPRAIWSGSISFGLVNIPVKLYPATTPKDVRFNLFAEGTGRRIRYRRVTEPDETLAPGEGELPPPAETAPTEAATESQRSVEAPAERRPEESPGPEVPYEDVVRGYEVEPGAFVMVRPEELEALRPSPDHVIEITDFVSMDQIDPIYFEKSYYVAPQAGAERPYALLLSAMERSNRAGIAHFVLRTKEYLAAIRPMDEVIALETLFFADEIRAVSEIWNLPAPAGVPDRELTVAAKLIDLLATDWEPGRYTDSYRERVLELIRSKAESRELVEEHPPPERPGVPDLMAALRASVDAARKEKANRSSNKRRRTG